MVDGPRAIRRQVGYDIAERLPAAQNDVAAVDSCSNLVNAVLDVRGAVGHGARPKAFAVAERVRQVEQMFRVSLEFF